MRRFISVLVVLLLPLAAYARWRVIPLDEAVKDSDLIVVGIIHDVSEVTNGAVDWGSAVITVDEVLRGDLQEGQKLSLQWQNESGVICPRINHGDHEGKQFIWLLKRKPFGKVAADNPGRFIDSSRREDVVKLIRANGTPSGE
jgi:hypothetical protein